MASLVALAVIAGAVGLFAYRSVYVGDEQKAAQKAQDERLFAAPRTGARATDVGAPKAEFVRVVVTTGGERTVLERSPGAAWRIVSPVNAPVDALVVDGIVSHLQTGRFVGTIEGEATDADLVTYGLDHPAFAIEAEAVVGGEKQTVTLEGGRENPFDGSIYMRKNGSRVIQMAEGGARWSLAKTTFDIRDKDIFAFGDETPVRVAVKTRNNDWELERGDDTLWHLVRPFRALADGVTVQAVLGAFRGERALAFLERPPVGVSFDRPSVIASVGTQKREIRLAMVEFQAEAGASRWFAQRVEGSDVIIAEISQHAHGALDRNPAELRDKSLIAFAKQAVTQIVFRSPNGEVVIERDPESTSVEGWTVTAPIRGHAKAYKVANALWLLSSIKSGATVAEKADTVNLERFGLSPQSAREVRVAGKPGILATLRIGKEVEGKPSTFYAIGSRGSVVEADGSRFGDLPWGATEVLDTATDAGSGGALP
jgi:hypothetical protein